MMQAINIKISTHSQQIIRTPYFLAEENLRENVDDLKLLIKEASPEFYNIIRNIQMPQIDECFNKMHFTIWKYFNRAKFRAVPFGSFASVAITPDTNVLFTNQAILKDRLDEHLFRDWDDWEQLLYFGKELIKNAKRFVTNSTVYYVGGDIRFIVQNGLQFEINVVNQFEELNFLCGYCIVPREKADLYYQLRNRFSLDSSSITKLLIQLTSNHLLLTDNFPNVIGEDYFLRQQQSKTETNRKVYRITQRQCISGPITGQSLKGAPELINFLNAYLPYSINPDLNDFLFAFKKKFDRQSVPLSVALDPELGIGYAMLEKGKDIFKNEIFKDVFNPNKSRAFSELKLNPLLAFIFAKSAQQDIVDLEEFCSREQYEGLALPNSFSMLYNKWNGKIVIQHIGGCTANALIGRFTLCGGDFDRLGKQIAELEQDSNPNAAYFDVSYQAEKHVDNVNRRKRLYKYELPLFNWCESNDSLTLNDIYVSVKGEEIILKSARLGKRLIPRIPTAYNYIRSNFSVYRFLSDLQHHLIRTDLNLNIRKYIPGQVHYSRIVYKEMILSPEMWLLDKEIVQSLNKYDLECGVAQISKWLVNNKISTCFSTGKADQNLTFNCTKKDDLAAFYFYCRQNHQLEIYLSEALISDETGIKNERGKQYHGQFLATFYHRSEIYKMDQSEISITAHAKRKIAPGTDWLYFEIYCHPTRANDILLKIKEFIKNTKTSIKKWFFIRYQEDGHHIRLRIELKNQLPCIQIINTVNELFKNDLNTGLISDIQIKTYVREIERYEKIGIPQAEAFFYSDSKYVLNVIKHNETDTLYHLTLEVMRLFVSNTFTQFENQVHFVLITSKSFSKEFAFNKGSYKAINRNYEQLRKKYKINSIESCGIFKLTKAYHKLIGRCQCEKGRHLLLADLLHMHVNRVFSYDSRKHEAILYQYLLKDMKRLQMGLKQTIVL